MMSKSLPNVAPIYEGFTDSDASISWTTIVLGVLQIGWYYSRIVKVASDRLICIIYKACSIFRLRSAQKNQYSVLARLEKKKSTDFYEEEVLIL